MKCPKCYYNLIWCGDHDNEDYGEEGDGIVSNYTCDNEECSVTQLIIYTD